MPRSSLFQFLAAPLLGGSLTACEPKLVVADWECPGTDAGASERPNIPVELPWATGFERGFCDYQRVSGFCYTAGSFEITSSETHTGRAAASFSIQSDDDALHQSRCVRQGIFPTEAYYSAWYFIPNRAINEANWNLFFYQSGDPNTSDMLDKNWDVSIHDAANGDLSLFLRAAGTTVGVGETPVIPIAAWFRIEVFFRRAADATGEVTLFQDGRQIASVSGVITDKWNWGQWYVGNLADGLTPSESTVYVDDVSIRETR
ncbi:MAG TPA: hypothetical protein VG937_14160 [Polyangiaceae bacterium]|nr:hypothetical protein [Polyangiaceae bacterium]